jgi:hypothetical protein
LLPWVLAFLFYDMAFCMGFISPSFYFCCLITVLQVLASIQLDATLASIKQEARHDGVLAERLAHWTAVFRDRGAQHAVQPLLDFVFDYPVGLRRLGACLYLQLLCGALLLSPL